MRHDDGGAGESMAHLRSLRRRGFHLEILHGAESPLLIEMPADRRGDSTTHIVAFAGSKSAGDIFKGTYGGDVGKIMGRDAAVFFSGRAVRCIGGYAEDYADNIAHTPSFVRAMSKEGDKVFTGHSRGGVLAQYAGIESVMKYYTPVVSVVTFGSPGAFGAEGVSTYDKSIDQTRYYFREDRVANLGNHTGAEFCLPLPAHPVRSRIMGDPHPMINYLEALKWFKR